MRTKNAAIEAPRLTRKETAIYVPASVPTIKRWEAMGRLTPIYIGERSVVYDRAEIDAYIESCKRPDLKPQRPCTPRREEVARKPNRKGVTR